MGAVQVSLRKAPASFVTVARRRRLSCRRAWWLVAFLTVGLSPATPAEVSVSPGIDVGRTPVRVAMSPNNSEVYVANSEDGTISIVSTSTNKVVATLVVGVRPTSVAFSRDGRKAYVGLEGDGQSHAGGVVVIDTAKRTVLPQITVGNGIDCAARDLAVHPDGSKIYIAFLYCGLFRMDTITNVLSSIDETSCPTAVAFTPDGKYAYVNYQCAPDPGANGHDPIFKFDARTDKPIDKIWSKGTHPGAERIANVGGPLSVSPNGSQLWANGIDACARGVSEKDPGGYDFEGCPPLLDSERQELERQKEKGGHYIGRGIVNIININSGVIEAKGFPAREFGSDKRLGAAIPTIFPDGKRAAVSTENRILVFDTGTLNQIDMELEIPRASNLVFTSDQRRAYVASGVENAAYSIQLLPEPEITTSKKMRDAYFNFWDKNLFVAAITHIGVGNIALWVLAWISVRFAVAFSGMRYILLLVEFDIWIRGSQSRMVRFYLRRTTNDISNKRRRQNVNEFVILPIRRRQEISTTEAWLADVKREIKSKSPYKAAIMGGGGTGKTFLVEEMILQFFDEKCIPILFQAVDYNGQKSLGEWLAEVLQSAKVPIRPDLLQSLPSVVFLIDQVSEVRAAHESDFWGLIAKQADPGVAKSSIILSGRPVDTYRETISQSSEFNDRVDLDEDLADEDIVNLGKAYFVPGGESDEVQALPKTIRGITMKPTAFVVGQYVMARRDSSRPISKPQELYQEILDRHVRGRAGRLRPDVVKSILQVLVNRHFGRSRNRGIPDNRSTLENEIREIFETENLAKLYGSSNIPSPSEFVDHLLASGLVYRTQTSLLFFHDSFEDWLLQESRTPSLPKH